MKRKSKLRMAICGGAAGVISGLLGTGGGMILVPLLTSFADLNEDQVFPASVSIILPICVVALTITGLRSGALPFTDALPYLIGSVFGGIAAGITNKKIPVRWLHRGLGILILC